MPGKSEKIAAKLKSEGEKTVSFFEGIQEDQWGIKMYADGEEWSILQIFTHITEAERSVPALIGSILGGGGGSPEDFDLNRYNESRVKKMEAAEIEPAALFEMFKERRGKTVAMVSGLSDRELDVEGRHPFLGISRVEEMFKLMYMHTQLHQRDIRRKLSQG